MIYSSNFYADAGYIKAHRFASEYINKLLSHSTDFEWIRKEPESASFDDMNFRYKNTVFSVLLKVFYKEDLLNSYIDRELDWIDITDKNNLFPIVFPVEIEKYGNTYKCYSLMEGLDFWDWMTTDTMNIMDIASDNKSTKMSHYELTRVAITEIIHLLQEQGNTTHYYYDNPTLPNYWPRIWFKNKKGKLNWVVVKYSTDENMKIPDINKTSSLLSDNDGYFASVIFEYDDEKPYRGCKLKIKHSKNMIEQVYKAKKH